MKHSSTLFLKVVLILIAIATICGLVWFPQTEGRATGLDLLSIYTDPFILYGYVASIPFFFGLYQAFQLLGNIEKNKAFSSSSVKVLRNIKYASLALIGFIAGGEAWIIFMVSGSDDKAGPVALGAYTTFVLIVIATFAAVLERLLQNAQEIKSENDLTV